MKNKSVALVVVLVASIGVSVKVVQGFNPFSKDDWEDVGENIKDTFKEGVEFMGKTFKNAKDLVEDAFKRVKECVAVVGLGSKWAAKKAAYEAAKVSLDAANELKVLDPRLTALEVAQQTAKTALGVAQESLAAAEKSAQAFSKLLQGLSVAAGKGINIKSMSFEAYMSELLKSAKGPRMTIDAVILGQKIKKDIQVDFSKPLEAAKRLMKEIIKELKEFKDLIIIR
ncbi:hypothetical protein KC460_03190 [Candidatus Dependentiae bacterium]|nr:hypothetical protein [Candidatus Dependentiae bacterium]